MTLQELMDMKRGMTRKQQEAFEQEFNQKWLEILDQIREMNNDTP